MPNWKTYEASVRLLSAIVAAHPNLKLDYNEVQQCFGSDSTVGGIKFQFATAIKKNVDQIRSARAAGKDCKDIMFNSNEMAKHFGSDSDVNSMKWQFRGIRAGAKIQQDALANGKDPKDFNVLVNPDSRKRDATAEKFGDGTTGSTPKKTRAPRNPSKKTPKKTALSSNEEGDDDSDLEMNTPSKKSSPVKKESMNKVKGGRVEKKNGTPARAAKNTVKSYIDSDDEEYDDELIIKDEDTNAYDFGRAADGDEDMLGGGGGGFLGHGHGNGRGNGSGGFVEEENDFFDSES